MQVFSSDCRKSISSSSSSSNSNDVIKCKVGQMVRDWFISFRAAAAATAGEEKRSKRRRTNLGEDVVHDDHLLSPSSHSFPFSLV